MRRVFYLVVEKSLADNDFAGFVGYVVDVDAGGKVAEVG